MEGRIKVTPQELRNAASNFSRRNTNVNNITNEMMRLVKALSSNWQGDASSAYIRQFSSLQDSMNRISKMIREHVDDLNDMASKYDSAEKESQNRNSGVSTNLID